MTSIHTVRTADPRRSPAGTYWITLAQAKKHWIQAMLNEETWIPFDVTYDVTAWSNPLLMNLDGGWSGDSVSPASTVVPTVAAADVGLTADPDLDVLLLETDRSTRGYESAGQTAYLFRDVWGLAFDHVLLTDSILRRSASTTWSCSPTASRTTRSRTSAPRASERS